MASAVSQRPAPYTTAPGPEAAYRRSRALPLLSVGLGLAPALPQFASGVPHAYLRVLIYDADSVLLSSQVAALTAAAKDNYAQLQQRVLIPPRGAYVLAYVGNESEETVYFDDVSVGHRQGLLVQETEYDPYGLELAGLSRARAPETLNQYTWNGKEKQSEFGLGWHDHGWRFYDPQLGRWVVSDPDAEEGDQESWGTYQFGLDNAVRYNDLDGRCPTCDEIRDFVRGIVNAVASNASTVGPVSLVDRRMGDSPSYVNGQQVGDVISTATGVIETAAGVVIGTGGRAKAPKGKLATFGGWKKK